MEKKKNLKYNKICYNIHVDNESLRKTNMYDFVYVATTRLYIYY